MFWLRLGYLFAALLVCSIGLGLGIARRIFHQPRFILPVAVGISGIVLYLAAWGIYVSGISWQWSYLVTAAGLAGLAVERKSLVRIFRDPQARGILIAWIVVELWVLLLELCIRHWGVWVGDWLEHYDRALFFLQHWPVNHPVQGGYAITARPPMMNVIESLFMAQVGAGYAFFQTISGFLNVTAFVAIAALACQWSRGRSAKIAAALVALNPWFIQNSTYTWTKLYCAFYVVLAAWLYCAAYDVDVDPRQSRRLRSWSLIMLSAGCVVHYSAAIYALYIAGHDLLRGRGQIKRILATWGLCALLMGTWIAWSAVHFGLIGTADTTTTVYETQRNSLRSLALNLGQDSLYSIIPHEIWQPDFAFTSIMRQHNTVSQISDTAFMIYQPALLLAWGLGGLAAIIWALSHWFARTAKSSSLLAGALARRCSPRPLSRWFWPGFVVWGYVGGMLVTTSHMVYFGGIAHIVLQPIVWVGLAWLASQARQVPRWLARLWAIGLLIDAGWILLHVWMQGRVLPFSFHNGQLLPDLPLEGSHLTLTNIAQGILHGLQFLGDPLTNHQGIILVLMIYGALAWWWAARRQIGHPSPPLPRSDSALSNSPSISQT